MEYKHKKSNIVVKWDTCMKQYTNRYSTKIETEAVWLNKDMTIVTGKQIGRAHV